MIDDDHDVAELAPRLDVAVGLDDVVQRIPPVDERPERPDSMSPANRRTIAWSMLGKGKTTLLPPVSRPAYGVTRDRKAFCNSGPSSDET